MGLTAPKPVKKISLPLLLDQLDSEWQTDKDEPTGLAAYVHCAARIGLNWLNGDPFQMKFPAEYENHRLAKMCRWLTGLEGEAVEKARQGQLAALRQVWPAYAATCTSFDEECEQLGFTWDGLDTLWQTESSADQQTYYLPQFHCRASEDFHLVVLAVVFLNRASKHRLLNLEA